MVALLPHKLIVSKPRAYYLMLLAIDFVSRLSSSHPFGHIGMARIVRIP
jgi:hypothetical protein